MSLDLTELLEQWPYEPGKLNVRLIRTPEGEERIQIRLDLGVLQMYPDGRPDGVRPDGFESLLEHFAQEADQATTPREPGQPETEPVESTFTLDPEQCAALRDEAVQYYHRYLALLALDDFDRVVRDTSRNLRVLDLLKTYAQEDEDRASMEPYRPYITMMRARALASMALRDNEPKAAIHAIDEGIEALRRHFASSGREDIFDDTSEVQMLRGMREALVPKLPVSQKAELSERLERALAQENYKLAAILRDEISLIDQKRELPPPTPS